MLEVRTTPKRGGEKETLQALLDNNRAVVVWKLGGLGRADLVRPVVKSGTSLLGLLKHLAYVELWWFCDVIDSQAVDYPWTDEQPDAEFDIAPGEDGDSVTAFYVDCVRRANEVIQRRALDYVGTDSDGASFSLRWVMVHMLEETARHAGHADILREIVDGTTGYMP